MPFRYVPAGLLVLLALVGAGCAAYLQPFEVERARPAPPTRAMAELRELPPPREKIVIAVYRFRDQTGQYRAQETGSTFSTAVTQGATSILIRTLSESGWFTPIEREALPNLLNERQIIAQIRSQHTGVDGEALPPLPPLLYAGILLEGGIVGYETNLVTSGVGVRYFGVGGSGQVRRDQVTISLRAISTQTGRVLQTIQTTKTILSQQVQGGAFRYVSLRRLLEAEAGYSYNEPPVLAVTEAIEEAVRGLIVEGVRSNLWALENAGDANGAAFAAYDQAVAESEATDAFGHSLLEPVGSTRPARGSLSVGAALGATLYEGDYVGAEPAPSLGLFLRKTLTPHLDLTLAGSLGWIAAGRDFRVRHTTAEFGGTYYLLPNARTTPFLSLGTGLLLQPNPLDEAEAEVFPFVSGAVGIERAVAQRFRVGVAAGSLYPLRDGLDGVLGGDVNDNFFLFRTYLVYRN